MVVPFVFSLDEYAKQKPTYLWVANKFYDFCSKNNFPIIVQEKFTKDPNYYIEKGHNAMGEKLQQELQYKLLSNKDFFDLNKFIITKEEEKRIINKYKTIDKAAVKLLQEEDVDFEEIIEEKLKLIMNSSKQKIESIITWTCYPSLEKIANKYNIPVLNYELSTIRPGKYREFLGYCKFGSKYDNKNSLEDFSEFKYEKKKMLLLNNKEIVNLLIDDEHISFINAIDKNPEYEVGLALGLKKDYLAQAYDGKTYDSILKRLEKIVPQKKISLRSHPAMPFDETKYEYNFDHSYDSIEWITKCKSIVCSVSNIGYEAILFNRGVISTNNKMITSFGKASSLDYYDPKYYGLLELNFLTFAYYTPYELMFDVDYIRFRLEEKDIYKIYNYNQNYILKRYGFNSQMLKSMNQNDRFISILNTHNIEEDLKNRIICYFFEKNIEKTKIEDLENKYGDVCKKYSEIYNSKGWQLLEKLRKIKPGK